MDSLLFISLMIVALTQMTKSISPNVKGWVTIVVALLIGVLVSLFGSFLGLDSISLAEGIASALGAVGISVTADKAAPTDANV